MLVKKLPSPPLFTKLKVMDGLFIYTKETHIHLYVKLIGRTQFFLEKSVLGTSKNCVVETVRPQQLGASFVV